MIGPHGENLAFVFGVPRSGTTLLCALLSNHPDIVCPPEPWLMLALESVGRTGTAHPADARLLATGVSEFLGCEGRIEAARAFARAAYNETLARGGGRVLIDKTPRYYHILPFIREVFPAARAIWMRRNPFDVAASYKATWGVDVAQLLRQDIGHPAALDLIVGLRRLRAHAAACPRDVRMVDYDQLVHSPDTVLESVLQSLDVSPHAGLIRLDDALDALRSSSMGDPKILQTSKVHAGSIGTGMRALPLDALQTLHDALGVELIRDLAGDRAVDQLRDAGVVDRGLTVTGDLLERAEAALSQRWSEVSCPADVATRDEIERIARAEIETREAALEDMRRRFEATPPPSVRLGLRQTLTALLDRVTGRNSVPSLPSLSLIITFIDPGADLRATVDSIVTQAYPGLEHVVVVAGASARSATVVEGISGDRSIVLVHDANRIDAINAGLANTSGDIFAWIDAGQTVLPGALQRVGKQFVRHSRWQAAYYEGVLRRDGWMLPEPERAPSDLFSALAGEVLPAGGVFLRREQFRAIGRLKADRPQSAEVELWLALTRWYRLGFGAGQVIVRDAEVAAEATSESAGACDEARREFRRSMRIIGTVLRLPRHLQRRIGHAVRTRLRPRRWQYAIASRDRLRPPPVTRSHDGADTAAVCPLTGRPVSRMLLSVVDARCGPPRLARIYACDESGVAILRHGDGQPGTSERRDASVTAPGGVSPFRGYRATSRCARRLERILAERDAERRSEDAPASRAVVEACGGARVRRVLAIGGAPALDLAGVVVVRSGDAAGATLTLPGHERFDVVLVAPDADRLLNIIDAVRRLQLLLEPGGRLVISAPNLDSAQLELFGPTWSPWHLGPGSVFVCSAALGALARQNDLRLRSTWTWSDPLTTARSLEIREHGLAEPLPPAWAPPPERQGQAERLVSFCRRRMDPRGRGDFITATFQRT